MLLTPAVITKEHIGIIRQQQRAALSGLQELFVAAQKLSLEQYRQGIIPQPVGLSYEIVYHLPDQPALVNGFAMLHDDYPVPVAGWMFRQGLLSAEGIVAASHYTSDPKEQAGSLLAPMRQADDDHEKFVFPRLLGMVIHWVDKIEGPISHIVAGIRREPQRPNPVSGQVMADFGRPIVKMRLH